MAVICPLKAGDILLKEYPQDSLILRYRALTLEKLGRFDEALKLYQEILSHDPNDAPAHLFLGPGTRYFDQLNPL